jgi:hypothetical protein
MKTAMQELFSQLETEYPKLFNINTLEGRKFINDYYKFIELEKQQIKECWEKAQDEQRKEFSSIYCSISADKYYNETFKTK